MIYMAYGSNLNLKQMAYRCPNAEPLGHMMLPDYKLVFRGVADIIKCKNSRVPVGLWSITEECEDALDTYEGFPSLYRKSYIPLVSGKTALVYQMNSNGIKIPSDYYFKTILEGYDDFGIDTPPLYEALSEAFEYSSIPLKRKSSITL
jgi:gamma-glutamylcyclotransferase (GGCT)/AIG2-like uncharacterized protein YtfP